jgi:hypothetical protein
MYRDGARVELRGSSRAHSSGAFSAERWALHPLLGVCEPCSRRSGGHYTHCWGKQALWATDKWRELMQTWCGGRLWVIRAGTNLPSSRWEYKPCVATDKWKEMILLCLRATDKWTELVLIRHQLTTQLKNYYCKFWKLCVGGHRWVNATDE